MSTPSGAPTLSVATDKPSYNVGDMLTLTVTYADAQANALPLHITVTGTDSDGNVAAVQTDVMVTQSASGAVDVQASDSFGDTYAVVSNDGTSQAVLQTTVQAPPAQVISPA
jgi:hypothetical protein